MYKLEVGYNYGRPLTVAAGRDRRLT